MNIKSRNKKNVEKTKMPVWLIFLIFLLLYIYQNHVYTRNTINHPLFLTVLFILGGIGGSFFWEIRLNTKTLQNKSKKNNWKIFLFNVFGKSILLILIFSSVGNLLFGFLNKNYASKNSLQYYSTIIEDFHKSKTRLPAMIEFQFNGKSHLFVIANSKYNYIEYENKNKEMYFSMNYRAGLFGSYFIENWEISD